MSTITITNNFNAPIGQHIDHVDKIEARFDKDMGMQISMCDSPIETPTSETEPISEPLFKYIHPNVTQDSERIRIHREIVNLVTTLPLPQICQYLMEMEKNHGNIYLSKIQPALAFEELHRIGMPDETVKGFSNANFVKYFNVKQ